MGEIILGNRLRAFAAIALYLFWMPATTIFPGLVTDDIGDEAAEYLLDDRWDGLWTRNLMVPRI